MARRNRTPPYGGGEFLLAQCETLGEYMSAWRIEIRTGFYHRAKKTRPIKGLK